MIVNDAKLIKNKTISKYEKRNYIQNNMEGEKFDLCI